MKLILSLNQIYYNMMKKKALYSFRKTRSTFRHTKRNDNAIFVSLYFKR